MSSLALVKDLQECYKRMQEMLCYLITVLGHCRKAPKDGERKGNEINVARVALNDREGTIEKAATH